MGAGYLLSGNGFVGLGTGSKDTVTVTGTAKSEKSNEIAVFTINISEENYDKNIAVEGLNKNSDEIVAKIKDFGIVAADLKTENFNVYQKSEWNPIYQRSDLTNWVASVMIEIKLRDKDKASELTTMLATLDVTNVNGPEFQLDDSQDQDFDLLSEAFANAYEKATVLAKSSGRGLGKVVKVIEGAKADSQNPVFDSGIGGAGGAGVPMESGTTKVEKSVNVTFELE